MSAAVAFSDAHQPEAVVNPKALQPRSPSPPPPPPATLTPGPRATALQKVFNDALSHTLRACSYTNFAACFPTPATYVSGALDGLHRDFVKRLEEVSKKEFASLIEERQVVPSLNELDRLVTDAKRRKELHEETSSGTEGHAGDQHNNTLAPTAPHLLPPSSLLMAHLYPFLSEQAAALTQNLQTTQQSNVELVRELDLQRSEIDLLLGSLEATVRDLEGAKAVFTGEEMEGIEEEIKQNFKVART